MNGAVSATVKSSRAPILVYLVTEDWYFLSHRLPMAYAAREAGFEVHVAARVGGRADEIRGHGFRLHALDWRRGSLNPFGIASNVRQVRQLYRRVQPDIVHHVALQPSVIGSIACLGLPIRRVNALAGLGYGFTSRSVKARAVNAILSHLLGRLLNRSGAVTLVQNPDDREMMLRLGIGAERIIVIPGSGVDIDRLQPLPEPGGPMTAAFVGRILADKGIRALVAAHDLLRGRGEDIRLLIAGTADDANPSSISHSEIEDWKRRPGIALLGHVADIREVWAQAQIAVLPSRREGLPKSLLEAAACGRPIVATDVPGCREIARPDLNAILVPVDDARALAEAISRLARDPQLRQRFGAAGRHLAVCEFSDLRVGREIVTLYKKLLAEPTIRLRADASRGKRLVG